jgi:hypothetical protein
MKYRSFDGGAEDNEKLAELEAALEEATRRAELAEEMKMEAMDMGDTQV